MSEFFDSINAGNDSPDQQPRLTPEYWASKAEGMLPSEVAHPYAFSILKMDIETNKLFVRADSAFDGDAYKPGSHYGNRFGLMRIYQAEGDQIIDGFIVDIRSLEKGGVDRDRITPPQGDYSERTLAIMKPSYNFMPVLGYVYTDINGGMAYDGDDRLVGAAQGLVENVDSIRNPKEKERAEKVRTSESVALDSLKDLVGDNKPTDHTETPIGDALAQIEALKSKDPTDTPKKSRFWRRDK